MSPHAVNSFVNDLVAMAKAMEQVPELEEDVRALSKECDQKTLHIRELETHIIDYKATISAQLATIRDLEVARDDAEFRFLELEDKTLPVVKAMRGVVETLGVHILALDPPKPEPKVEDVKPIESSTITEHGGTVQFTDPSIDPLQGQSEPDPTPTDTHPASTTGTTIQLEPIAASDPEPAKYSADGYITQAWWDWSDRNLYGKVAQ